MRGHVFLKLSFVLMLIVADGAYAQSQGNRRVREAPRPRGGSNTNVAARPQRGVQQPGQTVKEEIVSEVISQVVAGGLKNPCGVAVQPKTNAVFIADSGTGRIVRLNDVPGQYDFVPVITGFATESYGKGPSYEVGPLGLAFMNKYQLIVGGGGMPDGDEVVHVFRVPPSGTIQSTQAQKVLGPIPAGADTLKGEGNFYGVTIVQSSLFVTCNGDDTKGWIAKADIGGGDIGALRPFIKTKELVNVDAPTAATPGRRGQLVASQMGEVNVPNDSRLTVYDPKSGKLLLDVATGLHDIAGLAISPQTGRIYAVDFAWMAPEEGGLYRLDLRREGGEYECKAALLMPLDRPSALNFAEDGTLWITTFGSLSKDYRGGTLVRVYNESKL